MYYIHRGLVVGLFSLSFVPCSAQKAFHKKPVNIPTRAQIEGVLLGEVLGDVLGRVSSSTTHTLLLEKVYGPSPASVSIKAAQKSEILPKGLLCYTENIMLAFVVLEVCTLARKHVWSNKRILDAIARGFVYWADATHDSNARNRTGSTAIPAVVLKDLVRSARKKNPPVRWWKMGNSTLTFRDNNSSPLLWVILMALVFYDDPQRVHYLASAIPTIAYNDPVVEESCVIAALSMVYALQSMNPSLLVKRMITTAHTLEKKLQGRLHLASPTIKPFNFISVKENPALMFEGTRRALKANQCSMSDMLRYISLVSELSYAGDAGWAQPDIILGASLLGGDATGQTNGRTGTGGLLGWLIDEALAASLYVFLLYGAKPSDGEAAWHGIQETVWTVGNSGVMGALSGSLLSAYKGGLTLPKEDVLLLPQLGSYTQLQTFAQYLQELFSNSNAAGAVPPLITPYSVYGVVAPLETGSTPPSPALNTQ